MNSALAVSRRSMGALVLAISVALAGCAASDDADIAQPGAAAPAAPAGDTAGAETGTAAGLIVSQAEFQALAAEPQARILDVRSRAEYERGHIEGAVHLPWQALNVSERDGIRNEYADDADIEAALREAGVDYGDVLLVYGATSMAGRAFTVLEYAGFDRVHVLDGGLSQWSGPLSTAGVVPEPSDFRLTRQRENRVGQDFVADHIDDEGTVIIDGRYVGASEDGAIPSSRLIPVTDFLDPQTSALRPREEVLAELAAQGITPDKQIVSYCGSGAFASSSYLFLKDLGFEDVKFYDASWDEWSRSDAPQALGLANFSFAGDALDGDDSLGPRFLDQHEVRRLQEEDGAVVVDVRPQDDFVVGHIPGSVNVYWNDTLTEDRRLKSTQELHALFQEQGVTPDRHVVLFARGGLQLAQAFTVLKLLGFEQVDAFEGAWEGWVNPGYGPVDA